MEALSWLRRSANAGYDAAYDMLSDMEDEWRFMFVAVIRAIEDAYESVLNGDIQSTAVIYLVYKDGELRMCDYHIFRDTYKDWSARWVIRTTARKYL